VPITTGDANTDRAVAEVRKDIEALRSDISKGSLLVGISVTATAKPIAHKLGRKAKGYLVVGSTVATSYADENAGKADLDKFIYVKAALATTISLWVF
jgi:hypothetical protein